MEVGKEAKAEFSSKSAYGALRCWKPGHENFCTAIDDA